MLTISKIRMEEKKKSRNLSRFPILKLARRLGLMYVTSIDKKKRDGDGK